MFIITNIFQIHTENTMVILYNRRYNAAENKANTVLVLDNKRYELIYFKYK